jgi:outer membrane protein assembly factor BamD (BamD/ComL family)
MRFLKLFPFLILAIILIIGCGSGNKSRDANIESPEVLFARGNDQFNAGKYQDALQTYESLLVLHPTSDLHVDTQLRMAETYGKMDKFEEQMTLLKRVLEENIIPGYVPQIYIQIGKFYERAAKFNPGVITSDTTDLKTAIRYYERANRYEDSEDINAKAEAVYRLGLVKAKLGITNDATLYYETVANQYPNTPFGVLAKVKLQDPSNTSELPMDEASMEKYYDQTGTTAQTGETKPVQPPEEEEINLFQEEN